VLTAENREGLYSVLRDLRLLGTSKEKQFLKAISPKVAAFENIAVYNFPSKVQR
jgi:hypothetical protein